jgi:hypothetical protein
LDAAKTLSKAVHSFVCTAKARQFLQELKEASAAETIRHAIHGFVCTEQARQFMEELRQARAELEECSAIAMQRYARGYLGRREVRTLVAEREEMMRVAGEASAAACIQGACRGYLMRALLHELQAEWHAEVRPQTIIIQTAWRGFKARHYVRRIRRLKNEAATEVQSAYRRHLAEKVVEQLRQAKRESEAATLLQSAWRASSTRGEVVPLIQQRRAAVVRIQAHERGRVDRLEYGRRVQDQAARLLQGALLTLAAKAELAVLRHQRAQEIAALELQKVWRGVLGRRSATSKKVEQATALLDSLFTGDGNSTEEQSRDAAWLKKVSYALEFKEKREEEQEEQQLDLRRHREAGRLSQNKQDKRLTSQGLAGAAAMDRGLAALSAMRAREQLRTRAILIAQVDETLCNDTGMVCDAAMISSLSINEGLLARLSANDAASEVASLIACSWAIATAAGGTTNPAQRPEGMPAPSQVLQTSVTAIVRRLAAESASNMIEHRPSESESEENDQNAQQLADEVTKAEKRAWQLKESALMPLRSEMRSLEMDIPELAQLVKDAAAKVPAEVKALREKRAAETAEAVDNLQKEREHKHSMTQSLGDIALHTQIEKERLEGALYGSIKKGPQVYLLVRDNVKKLQEQINELEVRGVSNQKNKGILQHTLRALEVRADKASKDAKQYEIYNFSEKMSDDDYKPSEAIKKKQARREEQEQQFQTALQSELAILRTDLEAKADYEVSALGAKLRAEAEVHSERAEELSDRLQAWRGLASDIRPWVGVLTPLAKANTVMNTVATRLNEKSIQLCFGYSVRDVVPIVAALKHEVENVEISESPRGEEAEFVGTLREVARTIGNLRRAYPDPERISPKNLDSARTLSGPLDAGSAGEPSPTGTPRADDVEAADVSRSAFEKSKRLPQRKVSVLETSGTGLAGLASMGSALDALSATLATAAGGSRAASKPQELPSQLRPPQSQALPQSLQQRPVQRPSSAAGTRRVVTEATRTLNHASSMPDSGAGQDIATKSEHHTATTTENRSDKVGAPLRPGSMTANRPSSAGAIRKQPAGPMPSQQQSAIFPKSASGTALKAIQQKRGAQKSGLDNFLMSQRKQEASMSVASAESPHFQEAKDASNVDDIPHAQTAQTATAWG